MSLEFKLWLSRSESMSVELQVFEAKIDKFVQLWQLSMIVYQLLTLFRQLLALLIKFLPFFAIFHQIIVIFGQFSRYFINLSSFLINYSWSKMIFHHIKLSYCLRESWLNVTFIQFFKSSELTIASILNLKTALRL